MRLRFRQLQAFHATVESGTVTGAAEALGISQPGISNLLSELERQTVLSAVGEYQILGQTGDTFDGRLPKGLGHIYSTDGQTLLLEKMLIFAEIFLLMELTGTFLILQLWVP